MFKRYFVITPRNEKETRRSRDEPPFYPFDEYTQLSARD
jgi:hypothetical protein